MEENEKQIKELEDADRARRRGENSAQDELEGSLEIIMVTIRLRY